MAITKLQPIPIRDLSGGMVSNVSSSLLPDNTSPLSVNFQFDVLGRATQRNGTTVLGAVVNSGKSCHGLGQFINGAGTINRLLTAFNGTVYSFNGTAWTQLETVANTNKVRFASLGDWVFRAGGGSALTSWNGNGSPGTTNLASAPNGEFVIAYKQRLYVAGNTSNPDRLFFSRILSASKTLSWDTALDYLDVNPDDSNNISGLAKISNLLLIFKDRTMYRWNGTSTDAEVVVDIGASNQECIAQCKGNVYFFNPLGIFVTNGGYPMEISRPVYDWISSMSASYYTSVAAFCDSDHYYCSIGNVTKNGRTFNNVWLVYTVSSQNWCVYSMGQSFQVMTTYVKTDNSVTYVGGDTAGYVQTLLSGTTDNSLPIYWEYTTKDLELGSRAHLKSINDIAFFVESGLGGKVAISSEGKEYKNVGDIYDNVSYLHDVNQKGRYLNMKIFGSNRFSPVIFNGYELLESQDLGPVPNKV